MIIKIKPEKEVRNGFFFNIFLDRINRINKIISRFPDETVKTASAYRRKASITFPTLAVLAFLLRKLIAWNMIVARHPHREAIRIFPVSSGNRK
jgi:hypothetical protein